MDLDEELLGNVEPNENIDIEHYGTKYHSGRYPWGSGENPYQHCDMFLNRVKYYRDRGLNDDDIAKAMSMSTIELKTQEVAAKAAQIADAAPEGKEPTEKQIADQLGISTGMLRANHSLATGYRREIASQQAHKLFNEGKNFSQIAREMGYSSDSSVRQLFKDEVARNKSRAIALADIIKQEVDKYAVDGKPGMIEVGKNVAKHVGQGESDERMTQALYILEAQGYPTWVSTVAQAGGKGQRTTIKVVCSPGTPHSAAYDYDNIHTLDYHTEDGGKTYVPDFVYPTAIEPKRVKPRWGDEGGSAKDGTIEIRRGVKDLDLGDGVNYAQVRILVNYGGGDKDRYMKGMAIYGDDKDFPPGVDVIYNTRHTLNDAEMKGVESNVFKSAKKNLDKDPNDIKNPFGSAIKIGINDPADPNDPYKHKNGGQSYWYDENGERHLSLINKKNDEGDWNEWSKTLPSQFLAKQNQKLIDAQLNTAKLERSDELDQILQLNNPVIRKRLLDKFADGADSTAVHLEAAAIANTKYQVILPLTTIKDNEVYAPNFPDGTKVVLVRYPHGGTFESPELIVNNRNREGQRILSKNPSDAVGISARNAEKLSGADFDGDTVQVIPQSDRYHIDTRDTLPGLKDFDHLTKYAGYPGMEIMGKQQQQREMGIVSNLIMDMTIRGADDEDLAAAVRHSMVVIDAVKHELDYKQSYIDNNIDALKRKYQRHTNLEGKEVDKGAATLITRAKNPKKVPKTQGQPTVNKETGELEYKPALEILDPEDNRHKRVYQKGDEYFYINKEGKQVKAPADANIRPKSSRKVYAPYPTTDPKTGETVYKNKWLMAYEGSDGNYYYSIGKTKADRKTYLVTPDMKYDDEIDMVEKPQMELVKDAHILSTGTPQENAYADYANYMKDLANKARKASANIETYKVNTAAKEAYSEEVKSLNEKLFKAELNDPRERKAQLATAGYMKSVRDTGDYNDPKDLAKKEARTLQAMRAKFGASSERIQLTQREWEAIQAGAISMTKLQKIADRMDDDILRQLATPRDSRTKVTTTMIARMKAYFKSGYTTDKIAEALGVSTATVLKYVK